MLKVGQVWQDTHNPECNVVITRAYKYSNSCDEFDVCAWFKNLCDKNKFFAWSYYPYGVSR